MPESESIPEYLYKILSVNNWQESQHSDRLKLPQDDAAFIHLSKEDQLDKIIEKYWSHIPEYVVLKVKTSLLPGKLIFEINPGGTKKYYHLYEGYIPLSAIVESRISKLK